MAEQAHSPVRPSQPHLSALSGSPEPARGGQETEIDLVELLFRMLNSWKLLACLAIVGMIAAAFYTTSRITPMYRATSSIYVIGRDSAINLSDLQLGNNMMNDYKKVFDIWEVHDEVIKNLRLNYSYTGIRKCLSVNNDTGTHILDISFVSPDAQEAAAVANEYANVVSNYISETMRMDKPSIMSVALTPTNPYNISLTRNIALGFLLGALAGAAIVTVQYLLDDKIRTAEDVRKYAGLVNLAIVPVEEGLAPVSSHHGSEKKRGRRK